MISEDITARSTLKGQTLTIGNNATVGGTLGVTGQTTLSDTLEIASGKNIQCAGTSANGMVLKNIKNAAYGALSGTTITCEIDLNGTPYYFEVLPTKA